MDQIYRKIQKEGKRENVTFINNSQTAAGRLWPRTQSEIALWVPLRTVSLSTEGFKDSLPDVVTAHSMITTNTFQGQLTNSGFGSFWRIKTFKRYKMFCLGAISKSVSASLKRSFFSVLFISINIHKNTA